MAVDDIFLASAVFDVTNASGEVVNTHQYRQTVWDSSKNRVDLCKIITDAVGAAYEDDILGDMPASVVLNRVDCFVLQGGGLAENSTTYGTAGSILTDMMTVRSAMIINKLTGLRGRSFRGRNYLPPIPEAQQGSSIVLAGFVTSVEGLYDTLHQVDDLAGNEFIMAVYSPTLTGIDTENPVSNDVVSFQVNNRLGSIRGRFQT